MLSVLSHQNNMVKTKNRSMVTDLSHLSHLYPIVLFDLLSNILKIWMAMLRCGCSSGLHRTLGPTCQQLPSCLLVMSSTQWSNGLWLSQISVLIKAPNFWVTLLHLWKQIHPKAPDDLKFGQSSVSDTAHCHLASPGSQIGTQSNKACKKIELTRQTLCNTCTSHIVHVGANRTRTRMAQWGSAV